MSSEEENYIKKQEQEKLRQLRRERQLDALRLEERDEIADALDTDEDVAQEALELGFDRETVRILHLVPLIQMAWADGTVSEAERTKVLELTKKRGIEEGSGAHDFLDLLLDREPSKLFFERVNRVIAHMIDKHPEETDAEGILTLCREVANASGGFLGFGDKTSDEERALLNDLAAVFQHSDQA